MSGKLENVHDFIVHGINDRQYKVRVPDAYVLREKKPGQ